MRHLLCFARGHEGSWEALCVDYDIAVQGASFDQVKDDLEAAISDYVEAASSEDEATRIKLLARRAPWSVRLTWTARILGRFGGPTRMGTPPPRSRWPARLELRAIYPNCRRPRLLILRRGNGSHSIYRAIIAGEVRLVTVSAHRPSEDIKPGTLDAMIRQSGLPKHLFR